MLVLIVFLVLFFASRMILEKANKKLSPEQKASLLDIFSKDRIYIYGALISVVLLFFASLKFQLIPAAISYTLYMFLIFIFIIITSIYYYKKLKSSDFPNSYINAYLISSAIRFLALLILLASTFYGM